MDVRLWIHKGLNFVGKHAPTILTATGIIGVGVTAILAGEATLEADKIIKKKENELGESLDIKEKAKLTYKCFIPPVAAGVATVSCIVGSNRSSAHQIATLLTASREIERQLVENREAVQTVFKDRGLRKVDEAVNENRAARYFANPESIYETGHGDMLCCEGFLTGVLFHADREWVRKCVNDFNVRLLAGEHLSYNDFLLTLWPNYDTNLLPNAGEVFGYNLDIKRRTLEIVEDSFLTQIDSKVGYIFNVRELPLLNYDSFY